MRKKQDINVSLSYRKRAHGGYGVMAAQQVVVLLARVRSSLATPNTILVLLTRVGLLVNLTGYEHRKIEG